MKSRAELQAMPRIRTIGRAHEGPPPLRPGGCGPARCAAPTPRSPGRPGHGPGRSSGRFARRLGTAEGAPSAARSARPAAACRAFGCHRTTGRRPAAAAKRWCQRQTAGRPIRARLPSSATLNRPAEPSMIRARAACFWASARPVYGGFSEGFDTLDLKDAKALLDELS